MLDSFLALGPTVVRIVAVGGILLVLLPSFLFIAATIVGAASDYRDPWYHNEE